MTTTGSGSTTSLNSISDNDYIEITFSHAQGDVDLSLYDSAGTFLRGSFGVVDNERIFAERAGGRDLLRAGPHNFAGSQNPNYT